MWGGICRDRTASLNLDLIFRAKCLLTEEVLTASGPLLATVQTVCRGVEPNMFLCWNAVFGEGSVLWLLLLSCRMCPVPLSARMCENRRDEEGSGRINLICRWNAHSSSVRPSCTHILLQKNITLSRLPSCLIMEYRVEFLNLFHFDLSPSSLSAHLLDYSAQLWR